MTSALASLSGTEGVRGAVIFDRAGMCVAKELPPPYEPVLMADVIKRLSAAFDAFTSLDESAVTSFYASCEGGGMFLRQVEHHTILVLTRSDVNMNLLNVALNVVALNLAREVSNDVTGSRVSVTASQGLNSSHMLSQSGAAPGEVIPPDAVGKAVVLRLLTLFTEYMGPAAKTVLKQQLAALGVSSRTLRHAQFPVLVNRLAGKLPSGPRQTQFLEAVRSLHE